MPNHLFSASPIHLTHKLLASRNTVFPIQIDSGNINADQEILRLAEPYLRMPSFYMGPDLCIGEAVDGRLVKGIKIFHGQTIAIGTYNQAGLLDGNDCMFYFGDIKIYTFGKYVDGNLREGRSWYLERNLIEDGSRNERLELEGDHCTRIKNDGRLMRGKFVKSLFVSGARISSTGVITEIYVEASDRPFAFLPTSGEAASVRESVYIQISDLAKPYINKAPSVRHDALYLLRANSAGVSEGIKRFDNGNIAIGTYNQNGLLDGPNCMFFFHERELYAFGDYRNGNLIEGTVQYLKIGMIEIGTRNPTLSLDGPDCKRIDSDGTTRRGVFRDAAFISGVVTDLDGIIKAIKPSENDQEFDFLPTHPETLEEKVVYQRISNAVQPYLEMDYLHLGNEHYIGTLELNGRMIEGVSVYRDGSISIGTYNKKRNLDGPDCIIYFNPTKVSTQGHYVNGYLGNGETQFLATNITEIGRINAQRLLHDPNGKRITSDGSITTGYALNGEFVSGSIQFPNGTIQLISSTDAVRQKDYKFEIRSEQLDFYARFYGQESSLNTGVMDSYLHPEIESPTSGNPVQNDLQFGVAFACGYLLLGVGVCFILKTLLNSKIYTQFNLADFNIGRREKRAINRQIGVMDLAGNQYHPMLKVTTPLLQKTFEETVQLFKSKISGLELMQPVGPVLTSVRFSGTAVQVSIGNQTTWLTEKESEKLALSIIHHINHKKDWTQLLNPTIFCDLLPHSTYSKARNVISTLDGLRRTREVQYNRLEQLLPRFDQLSQEFNAQFPQITYPSKVAERLQKTIEKIKGIPQKNLEEEFSQLTQRFTELITANRETVFQLYVRSGLEALNLQELSPSQLQSQKFDRLQDELNTLESELSQFVKRTRLTGRTVAKLQNSLPLQESPPLNAIGFTSNDGVAGQPISRYQLQERNLVKLQKMETEVRLLGQRISAQISRYREQLPTELLQTHFNARVAAPGWIELQTMTDRLSDIRKQLVSINDQTPQDQLHPLFPSTGEIAICKSRVGLFIKWENQELQRIKAENKHETQFKQPFQLKPVAPTTAKSDLTPDASSEIESSQVKAPSISKKQRLFAILDRQFESVNTSLDAAGIVLLPDSTSSPGQKQDALSDLHHGLIDYVNQLLRIQYKGDPVYKKGAQQLREMLVHDFHQHPQLSSLDMLVSITKKMNYLMQVGAYLNETTTHIERWHALKDFPKPEGSGVSLSTAWNCGVRDILSMMKWAHLSASPGVESVSPSAHRFEFALACVTEMINHSPRTPEVGVLRATLINFPGYQNRINRNLTMHSVEGRYLSLHTVIPNQSDHDRILLTASQVIDSIEVQEVQSFPPLINVA